MIDKIKMLTLRALVSDEKLMYGLVLKGGNALQLAYNITDRASMDIDFSISGDFSKEELERLELSFSGLLNNEFEKEKLVVIDPIFYEKPKQNKVKEWKGYRLEFKVVPKEKYDPSNMAKTRNAAYVIYNNNSTKFQVEISSYEYTKPKKIIEKDGAIFYVYTPEMIVFEKIRALCQSMPDYSQIISTARVKGRARDFYDIWNICNNYEIDFFSEENTNMLIEIFKAKRVPLNFLNLLDKYKDLQKEDWTNVIDTLAIESKEFDFYYNFVKEIINKFKIP